ncbi:MAG: membrane protein insertion efficiency factor YidD [Pseudomonadota bacterium]
MTIAQRALFALITAYKYSFGLLLRPSCRYTPSCSSYAKDAVLKHGALKGSWLTLKRLSRCHPLGGHGYDPVPGADGETKRR